MNAGTKLAALNKFRNNNAGIMRPTGSKVLVVYDVQVKAPEVSHVPLILNYGACGIREFSTTSHLLDRPSQGSRRVCPPVCNLSLIQTVDPNGINSVAPAVASSYSRAGVVVNFVTATGGDVEMLRSIECFYKYVVHFVLLILT